MKRQVIFITTIVVLLFILLQKRYVLKTDFDPYVDVLTTTNEAFVFVGKRTEGWSGSLVGMTFRKLFQIYPSALESREDLIVVHLKGNRIEVFDLKGFGFRGGAWPYKGEMYFGRGGPIETWPLLWKWSGSNFIKIDQERALAIRNSFKLLDDLLKAEGWKETNLQLGTDGPAMSFPLDSGSCLLSLKRQPENGIAGLIELRGEGTNIPQESFAQIDDSIRWVGKSTYEKEELSDDP